MVVQIFEATSSTANLVTGTKIIRTLYVITEPEQKFRQIAT